MTASHETTERVAPRLLIVGPQGSGKGTQGAIVGERFGIPAIATGDVFRRHITEGTDLGREVKAVIDAGDLVGDELTFSLLRDRLNEGDTGEGFLLDGFPRNIAQVSLLDSFLEPRDEALTGVVHLDVPREVSIDRLVERARVQGRSDDTDEVISNRLAIYERETAPILEIYRERRIVLDIDGVGSLETVTARVFDALAARGIVPA